MNNDANLLISFLNEASKHVGENGTWTWSTSGLGVGNHWCAAFVVAVAKTVGNILDKLMLPYFGAGDIPRYSVPAKMGEWLRGPHQGVMSIPQPGDLIFFRWARYTGVDTYFSDHVGIVTEVTDSEVITIEGNSGYEPHTSLVRRKSYSLSYNCISGYYRPNWGVRLGGTYKLYVGDELNTNYDASIREVGFIDDSYEPSIISSDIKLSVINYTSMLGAIFNTLVSPQISIDVNTSSLPAVERSIVDYFISKKFPASAGVGVLANIYHESGCRTNALGDYQNGSPTSFGICQWHLGRGAEMKKFVGSNWADNLSGQLDFLYHELNTSYTSVLQEMKNAPNTLEGAMKVADVFVRRFEVPADIDTASRVRQEKAKEYWKSMVPQLV